VKRFLQILRELDGRAYGQLRRVAGPQDSRDMLLQIDHVQGDPHGPPSRLSLLLKPTFHPVLERLCKGDAFQRLAAEDLFLRNFGERLPKESVTTGEGPGGKFRAVRPGPEILTRSACRLDAKGLLLRFTYAFPAEGRRIQGGPAAEALLDRLPAVALDLLATVKEESIEALANHLRERRALREALAEAGLVAFVPEDAIAARAADGKPVAGATRLRVPPSLSTTLQAPSGPLRGLGIGKGLTVILGAAFHGKTTLLEALRHASFDLGLHDGLAHAVALPGAEFVAVEEDRAVSRCDLSPFFRRLAGKADPGAFAAREASGSTSQAANLHEAISCGAPLLLIDEDASAANFLTRDARIASLLPEGESVVPLASRVRELVARGHSVVVVAGASAEWLSVADRVIVLDQFQPSDVTEAARRVVVAEGLAQPKVERADWDACLADVLLDGWKELAQLLPARVRAQDGLVRLANVAEARMPRRFSDDDRLRAAGVLLCSYMRHCRDRALAPTRNGLLAMLATGDAREWGIESGHDLARPTAREVWGVWTRLVPGRGGPAET